MEQDGNIWTLVIAEGVLLIMVLVFLPLLAKRIIQKGKTQQGGGQESPTLKGLGLPGGSVRSMLALIIVGSYMVVAVIGSGVDALDDNFTEILSALSGISGAVVGFYFGSRGSGGNKPGE